MSEISKKIDQALEIRKNFKVNDFRKIMDDELDNAEQFKYIEDIKSTEEDPWDLGI